MNSPIDLSMIHGVFEFDQKKNQPNIIQSTEKK